MKNITNQIDSLKEAHRIFIDAHSCNKVQLLAYYSLVNEIFEGEPIPDRSIVALCLERVASELNDSEVLYYRYFCDLSFAEIARKLPITTSPSTASLAHKRALKELRKQKRKFFLPASKAFLKRYAIFMDSVLAGTPSKDDLSIRELGLTTRTANALYRAQITTASEMYFATNTQLSKVRNLGQDGIQEIAHLKSHLMSCLF